MRTRITIFVVLVASLATAAVASEATVFDRIADDFEAIRQALLDDSTEGTAEHARSIAAAAADLEADFNAAAAGVALDDADAVSALLDEVETRARSLADADGLAEARQALASLTQPLVRWHRLVQGPKPVVAYCPMEKKAWLQPDEAIGNPYDPTMLRCGEVVQR
ncbi:MAG TPA: hypothetical protein VLB51_12045 [Methylomirabilota bacterium]|nr:hypothetical protein [Methylomirabilota bacterium]